MIQANTGREWLPLYEALASEVRLSMLEKLSAQPMNIKQLAAATGLSSAIVTMHVRKLEAGGLIKTELVRKGGGTHKMCSLISSDIQITLPSAEGGAAGVDGGGGARGHYTSFDVHPTCGLATRDRLIGQFDDPRYFYEPERMNAGILGWDGAMWSIAFPAICMRARSWRSWRFPWRLAPRLPESRELAV